ncbi:acylphosphatase [miscellaneous Crenarchaeota group archaeon SMTZ1-55]|nr:MAG: acylphosphatase [miscellaneous Crenarchaeota group archaeon SMTZ1-55]
MHARAHVLVKGQVQGVFFRASMQREARKRQVVGWVRNLSDGCVEAVVEGEREQVVKIIEYCRKGPSLAEVTEVKVTWGDASGCYKTFRVV